MKPLRFHPHIQSGPYHRLNPCMVESKDGAYVLYEDYAKLEERVLAFMAAKGLSTDWQYSTGEHSV